MNYWESGRGHRPLKFALAAVLSLLAVCASAGVSRLLVLHTNDLHDHVRPGYNGVGGLPYVAGYIASTRSGRDDVLLLDAGDVVEKGDMVADRTHGELTYAIMKRMRYDAVTIGNHDNDQGLDQLRRYEQTLGQQLLCLNRIAADGSPLFETSRIVRIGTIKVGIIGLIVPQDQGTLDLVESGKRLAQKAEALARETDLVIALCHMGSQMCKGLTLIAPAVNVFVSGHSHEAISEPIVVHETGAIIVQAGSNANWVGRLELEVDTDSKKIRMIAGGLAPMAHDVVVPDADVLALVKAEEARLCPEATENLLENPAPVGQEIAWLAAEAMRRQAGVEIGFCNPGYILRAYLPSGPVDVNALFLTGGQRGHRVIRATLTGAEITAYLQSLASGNTQTAWAGFSLVPTEENRKGAKLETTLEPSREYSIVMPEMEWSKRFLRAVKRANGDGPLGAREFKSEPAQTHFTDALTALLTSLPRDQRDVRGLGERYRNAAGIH